MRTSGSLLEAEVAAAQQSPPHRTVVAAAPHSTRDAGKDARRQALRCADQVAAAPVSMLEEASWGQYDGAAPLAPDQVSAARGARGARV